MDAERQTKIKRGLILLGCSILAAGFAFAIGSPAGWVFVVTGFLALGYALSTATAPATSPERDDTEEDDWSRAIK